MPRWAYRCAECSEEKTLTFPSVADRDVFEATAEMPVCDCGGILVRAITAPGVAVRGGTPRFYR